MKAIKTVLFDIGGVLSHDGHDTYLTRDTYGIANRLGQSKEQILTKSAHVFRKYAVLSHANEADFWREIGEALGTKFSEETVRIVKQQIQDINSESEAVFRFIANHDISIGIISNSTPFFYPPIAKALHFETYMNSNLYFLSHIEGCLKSNGLFELAKAKLEPSETLIIDDRQKNVVYAEKLGFMVAQYSMESGQSLLAAVRALVNNPMNDAAFAI